MTTNDQNNIERSPEETLAYHKALLKQMSWVSYKGKTSELQLSSLSRGIQKIVRNLNSRKPTFLQLKPNTEVVFITPDQYKSIQMLKLRFEHIVAEEEKKIADGSSEADELELTK